MKRKYEVTIEHKKNEDGSLIKSKSGTPIKIKKNVLPIMTIETGRDRSIETNTKLEKLLNEGFTANYYSESGKITSTHKFVFLDNVLSGSQKNLTRNALTTTDVYLFPVEMKDLTICIGRML